MRVAPEGIRPAFGSTRCGRWCGWLCPPNRLLFPRPSRTTCPLMKGSLQGASGARRGGTALFEPLKHFDPGRSGWNSPARVKQFKIAVYPGDGIGVDVTTEAMRVLDAVQRRLGTFQFNLTTFGWGS